MDIGLFRGALAPFQTSHDLQDIDSEERWRATNELTFVSRAVSAAGFALVAIMLDAVFHQAMPEVPLLLICAFELLVNQPYRPFARILGSEKLLYAVNVTLNVVAIAMAMYLVGGLANRFATSIFFVSIGLEGARGGRGFAYWVASLGSLALIAFAVTPALGIPMRLPAGLAPVDKLDEFAIIVVNITCFYFLAYFTAIPSMKLREDIAERQRVEQELRVSRNEVRILNEGLEQRVAERTSQLEAVNKEMEAFSYSVSHDLRAPLRILDGFSRILLQEHTTSLPSEALRSLQVIRDNAQQMGQLVDDLLAFSLLGRQSLRKKPVALSAIVQRVLDDLSADIGSRQIEFVIGDLPQCEADPALLRQVYVNLVSNANKFTRLQEATKIEIGGQETIYFVKDNGVGFNMQYAHKRFGVFQRLHHPDEFEGTGVGLAICDRIVRRHGGRIWAEAEIDKGATFFFTLKGASIDE